MRICILLICTNPTDPNKPTAIRRWDSWPCVPRIGEKYRWYIDEEDPYLDEPDIGRVMDVIHEPVRRNFFERLFGKPSKVIMVVFNTSDQQLLQELRKRNPRWQPSD